jgi:hypothetical protein
LPGLDPAHSEKTAHQLTSEQRYRLSQRRGWIWKDTRFYFDQKDTFVNAGGLAEFRNLDSEENDFEYLQKIFGEDVVTLRKTVKKANSKHPYQKNLNFPL